MQSDRELMQQWLQPGAIVPVDMNTVRILLDALRERLAQPEQRREWVGLTKEEAKEISLANRPYVVDMIAALEARLKEKNNAD